jgi:hypothetical protein
VYLLAFSRIFSLGILIFKGLNAQRLYKSFRIKGLTGKLTQHKYKTYGLKDVGTAAVYDFLISA